MMGLARSNGAPDQLTLPGMPAITYAVGGEGRPTTVGASAGQNPATAVAYGDGAVPNASTSVTLGSGDVDSYAFDGKTGRMDTYTFSTAAGSDAGTLTWNPNGTLKTLGIADSIATTTDSQTCNYGYDDLARLASVNCGSGRWGQAFTRDAFGNVTTTVPTGNTALSFDASFNLSTNRITSVGGTGATYSAAGNLVSDPVAGPANVNTFDAQGHALTLEGVTVVYDALGRAVEENNGGWHESLYAPDGRQMALMEGQTAEKDYVALPGGGVAVYAGGSLSYYMHADWEGSARLETNTSGGLVAAAAYSPYGAIYNNVGAFEASFTGQRQDVDATHSGGQYSFPMRYQNPVQGRWWTPGPAGLAAVDPANPQSWNAYAYVNGDPLRSVDPAGLLTTCPVDPVSGEPVCSEPEPPLPPVPWPCGLGPCGGGGGGRPCVPPPQFQIGVRGHIKDHGGLRVHIRGGNSPRRRRRGRHTRCRFASDGFVWIGRRVFWSGQLPDREHGRGLEFLCAWKPRRLNGLRLESSHRDFSRRRG